MNKQTRSYINAEWVFDQCCKRGCTLTKEQFERLFPRDSVQTFLDSYPVELKVSGDRYEFSLLEESHSLSEE
jgi:hypothetical protein